MIREFYLRNANGQTLNLNDFEFEFLHSVKGLGREKKLKVKQVGSHFEVVNTTKDIEAITASIHFTKPNAYQKYFDFVQFCAVEPLTLIYNPEKFVQTPGADIKGYRRECILTKITKEGYNMGYGEMSCPLEFSCLTPWYDTVYVQSTPTEAAGTKAYGENEYEFPITFPMAISNTVEIVSDSRIETGSPCRIRIYGPITNPSWTLYVNGVEKISGSVGTDEETVEIASGNYLEIDTINGRSIKQYRNTGAFVSDLYQSADFSKKRFVMLGNGNNVITVTSQGGEQVKLSVEAHIEYESV